MRRIHLVVLTLLAACARREPVAAPQPVQDLSALEARQAQHARDPDELTAIGIAFYQAQAYQRARDVFLAVLALRPQDFEAAVQLGLSYEALEQYDDALASYHRAQTMKMSRSERRNLEARLVALTRTRLAAEARQAIAAEQSLTSTPPVANSIAVLPWTYLGTDPELKPLERGLAHLVVSDLAKIQRLTLLERERVQALTDELALDSAGRIAPATAARSGRLLRAAQVVQGVIRETGAGSIRLDANVVSATTAEIRASGTASDRLSELFSMEKALVFELLGRMGIALTPAEQRAMAERPTADLQAFLAFSRGLEAEDRGNFSAAATAFEQAVNQDPSFHLARDRAAQTSRAGAASRMTPTRLAQTMRTRAALSGGSGIRSVQLANGLQGIAPTMAGRLGQKPGRLPPAVKAQLAEALRQDNASTLGTIGKIVVTIPRP